MNEDMKFINEEIEDLRKRIVLINVHIDQFERVKRRLIAESSGKPYCPKCFTLDVIYIKNMPTESKMVCRQYGCFYDGSEEEFHYQ